MAGFDPNQPRDEIGRWVDQSISFTNSKAAGRALGDSIQIDRLQYAAMSKQARRELIAHELAHNVVEDLIYHYPEEWDRATKALLLSKEEKGNWIYFQFMLGQMRFGEAIATSISAYVNNLPDPMLLWNNPGEVKPWNSERWEEMLSWSKHALKLAGYTKNSFNRQVEHLMLKLNKEIENE